MFIHTIYQNYTLALNISLPLQANPWQGRCYCELPDHGMSGGQEQACSLPGARSIAYLTRLPAAWWPDHRRHIALWDPVSSTAATSPRQVQQRVQVVGVHDDAHVGGEPPGGVEARDYQPGVTGSCRLVFISSCFIHHWMWCSISFH